MSHLHIRAIEVWPDVFAFFFLLSVAVAVVAVYLFGQRRGIAPVRWNFYQLVAVGVGLVGSKLYMLRDGELGAVLGGDGLPHATGMNLLGGVLAGALAVYLLRFLQRSKDPIFDAWAWLVPIAVLVGRVGCFAGGCCHGQVTSVPWATTYPAPALPVLHQWADGVLPLGQTTSLPVHPVPVYEFLLLLLLLQMVRLAAPRLQRSTLFLVTVGGYSLIRFTMEFFRYGGAELGPLKMVQWGLLAVAGGCAIWLWRREQAVVAVPATILPALAAQTSLLAVVTAASFWFDSLERASLLIGAAPWVGHAAQRVGQYLGRRFSLPVPAILSSGVALTMLASWSPLYKQGLRKRTDKESVRLSASGGAGEWSYVDDGCQEPPVNYTDRFVAMHARISYRDHYRQGEFWDLGLDYSRIQVGRYQGPLEGNGGDAGRFGDAVHQFGPTPYTAWGLGPSVLWDFYWGALGGGFQIMGAEEIPQSWGGASLYLRGGTTDVIFGELAVGPTDQPSMANGILRVGAGFTLGPLGDLRFGFSPFGLYLEPHFDFTVERVRVDLIPIIHFGPEDDYMYLGGAAALEFDVSGE